MKRFTMICFALLLTITLLTTTYAEGIQSEQNVSSVAEEVYAPLVSEPADEHGEVDLWDPDIQDDVSVVDASPESHAIEAVHLDDDVTARNDGEDLRKGSSSANDDMPVLCATRMNMGKGDILKLASSKKGYTFSSSDNKVAKISKEGVITAVSVGKATITAKSKSGQKATCKVTVLKGPKKVTLNKSQVSLETGKTCQLKATLPKGTYTWNLTWTSSNKEVAKVSSKGKVTAVGNGTAKITVETAGSVKATCKVTVKTGTIDLTNYVGKDIKETAKKLNLTYNGYGYGNSYITIEEVRDYVTGKNGTFIAINKRNSKYTMAGVTYGMNLDKADKTLISNNWRRTEVDRSNDFVHHYYYQNSKGHEIDLYIYEPETNKNIDMIIVRQTKNERWPEL